MKLATVRVIDSLPPGMTVDSDPVKAGPEILVPRPDGKCWAALPPRDCRAGCNGAGLIPTIVREPGEKPLHVLKPCQCVWGGIALAEKLEQDRPDGVKVTLASEIRAADDPNLRRRERVLREMAREQAKLDEAEAAKAAAMAPHLARLAELQRLVDALAAAEIEAHAILENSDAAWATALEELRIAEEVCMTADEAHMEAHTALAEVQTSLAAYTKDAEEAKATAERVGAAGGKRHRIQTQTRRIADLKQRLAAITRDLVASGVPLPAEQPPAGDVAATPEAA